MVLTSQLNASTLSLFSSANTANTASITIDDSKVVTLGGTNVYFPLVDDDLICTITPRTSGIAPLVEINSTGVYAYEFISNATREVSFLVQLSHQWAEGTAVVPHIHWCPSSANTSNAIISLDYWCTNIGETISGVTTISANAVPSGVAFQNQITYFPSVSLTGKTASCIFGGRMYRNPAVANDDFTGDCMILGIDIHVKNSRWGYNV